jgi:hypothetical protein
MCKGGEVLSTDILPVKGKVYWEEREDGLKPVMWNRRTEKYEDVIWTPQPGSQEAFLRSGYYEVLYSGTRGPGKTDALLMDYCQFVGKGLGADWRGILFRRTYPELGDVVAKSRKWFPRIFPGARYNASEHYWTFPDGETLLFRHFKTPDDYWNYHGHAYPWMGWEELTTWPTPDCYTSMMSCARSPNPSVPIRLRSTTNPYGCVPHGEVLTSTRGWVNIQDVRVGENVVSVNAAGEIVDSPVERVVEKEWRGEVVKVKSRGLQMEFTTDHRLPRMEPLCQHEVVPFETIRREHRVRRCGKTPALPSNDKLAEFLGCALINGSIIQRSHPTETGHEMRECVHLRSRFSATARVLKYEHGVVDGDYYIEDPECIALMKTLARPHERRIPREYINNPALLLGLMALGPTLYTESGGLKDDLAELATRCGFTAYTKYRSGNFEIFLSDRTDYTFTEKNHHKEEFEGTVYCLTVPETETFFIRQNGSVWLSGNSGHSWVKHRWRLPAPPGKMCSELITDSIDKNGDVEPPRRAIMGHIRENHVLLFADPGYIGRIKSSARNHAELEAWLNGSWDIVAGGMFDDVWDRNIHVLPNFPLSMIPKGWRLDRSYDHGQSRPFSVGWFAESNGEPITVGNHVIGKVRGDIVRIAEWYGWNGEPNVGARMLTSEIAKGILERESQMGIYGRVKTGVADGSIFDQYEPGLSIVGEMRKNGVDWYAADKGSGSRKQGWQQIRERLEAAKPGIEGFREEPGLFVCEGCDNFLRTIPVLPRSDRDLDDVDTDAEDHIADELRYRIRFKTRQMRRGSWK